MHVHAYDTANHSLATSNMHSLRPLPVVHRPALCFNPNRRRGARRSAKHGADNSFEKKKTMNDESRGLKSSTVIRAVEAPLNDR